MPLAERIRPHLPYLRRFARALLGSQAAGDTVVARLLEHLVVDPAALSRTLDLRVALYRALLFVADEAGLTAGLAAFRAGEAARPGVLSAAEQRLQDMPARAREAFLLVSMEGFTEEEAAIILSVEPHKITDLLAKAGREIAGLVATDVLIIEDEPLIALDLSGLVSDLGHRVAAMARTRSEAEEAFRRTRPGLVLADIQLADGSSGLDAVNDILGREEVPVVFITAFPERLLTGTRPEPAFLVTKPFQGAAVKATVSQALFFDQRARRRATRN